MEQPHHSQGLSEVILSVISTIFGLVMIFYLIPNQVEDPNPSVPNSRTFPYVISIAFSLFCSVWSYKTIKEFLKDRQVSILSIPARLFYGLGIGTLFVFIFYFIDSVGYLIGGISATALVIIAIEGLHRWRMAIVSGTLITVGFAFFFGKLLNIEIPVGILGLF
jgi:hypothetical protein